ncbi:MAG: low specificity L-threonine aldolase [Opitutaceae bacterium]
MSDASAPPSRPDAVPGARYEFASDNTAGICPEAWAALADANAAFVPSYGNDEWTARAADLIREVFETRCEVFFVFNGTAANSLALAALCQSYHSVICHELAHCETDECGAPEFFSNGTKLLTAAGELGRLETRHVESVIGKRTDIHFPKPRALSLTQATEVGTVYKPGEIRALCDLAHRHGLSVHMDGARFANAVAALGCAPADLSWRAGVDVLCLGGTKNGMSAGEAVVFFRPDLAREFEYRCKQAGQLCSKMRFLSAQWVHMLRDGAWLRHAANANACARRLEAGLRDIPHFRIAMPVEANGVFVEMPPTIAAALRAKGWFFYNFIGAHGYRLMNSWASRPETIDAFLADARRAAATL